MRNLFLLNIKKRGKLPYYKPYSILEKTTAGSNPLKTGSGSDTQQIPSNHEKKNSEIGSGPVLKEPSRFTDTDWRKSQNHQDIPILL